MQHQRNRTSPLSGEAVEQLQLRGISERTADRLGVVTAHAAGDHDDRVWVGFRHTVDGGDGDHWAYRTLTGEKRFFQSKGTERRLWNHEVIRDGSLASHPLIITEGHLDAMSCVEVGFDRVTSIPDGAPAKSDPDAKAKYSYLDGFGLESVTEFILLTDGDGPGAALLHDLSIRLGRSRCKWVTYPPGCKDANDVLVKFGPDALVQTINNAQWLQIDGLYTLAQLPPVPPEEPLAIGIPDLELVWKVSRGRLTVVVGIPGHGKTQFLCDVTCNMAMKHNWVIVVASFEDTAGESLLQRLRSWYLSADPRYMSDQHRVAEADEWIGRHFVFIEPPDDIEEPTTVGWLMERIEAAVLRYNASMAIIDPWNELDHSVRPMDVPVTDYIGDMIKLVRRHAKRFRYAAVVAAHPTKMIRKQDGTYPVPTGYNVADSAHWVNKPDVGISVYRDDKDTTEISCWKARRDRVIATRGAAVKYRLDVVSSRYSPAPDLEAYN